MEKGVSKFSVSSRTGLLLLILVLASVAVYSVCLFNGFVWDDQQIVVNNPLNRDFANIGKVFTSPDANFADGPTSYYRPLNRISYMVDYFLFGLNPVGYHAVNLFFHIVCVCLVYAFCTFLFADPYISFVTALLFAVHPVNAEPVNAVFARNNILAGMFAIGSLLMYIRAQKEGRKRLRYFSVTLFFLGLLCKEPVAMVVAVAMYYDYRQSASFRDFMRTRAWRLWPFLMATGVYLVLRIVSLHGGGVGEAKLSLGKRLLQNIYILPKYLQTVLLPVNINAYYTVPADYLRQWWLYGVWAAIVVAVFMLLRRRSFPTDFGLFWFAVNYIPISNIVPIPSAALADRYLYLPAIGLWLIMADLFIAVLARKRFRFIATVAGLLIIVMWGSLAFVRSFDWKNDIALFSSMVKIDPASVYGWYNLGGAYAGAGEIQLAEKAWRKTISLEPKYSKALNQLGTAVLMQNRPDDAERFYLQAIQADPNNSEAHYNLAMLLEERQMPREALLHYELFLMRVPLEHQHLVPEVRAAVKRLKGMVPDNP